MVQRQASLWVLCLQISTFARQVLQDRQAGQFGQTHTVVCGGTLHQGMLLSWVQKHTHTHCLRVVCEEAWHCGVTEHTLKPTAKQLLSAVLCCLCVLTHLQHAHMPMCCGIVHWATAVLVPCGYVSPSGDELLCLRTQHLCWWATT